jgi:hypothetical protein
MVGLTEGRMFGIKVGAFVKPTGAFVKPTGALLGTVTDCGAFVGLMVSGFKGALLFKTHVPLNSATDEGMILQHCF